VVGEQLVVVDIDIDDVDDVTEQEVTVCGGGHVVAVQIVGVTVIGVHVPIVGHDSHV